MVNRNKAEIQFSGLLVAVVECVCFVFVVLSLLHFIINKVYFKMCVCYFQAPPEGPAL